MYIQFKEIVQRGKMHVIRWMECHQALLFQTRNPAFSDMFIVKKKIDVSFASRALAAAGHDMFYLDHPIYPVVVMAFAVTEFHKASIM